MSPSPLCRLVASMRPSPAAAVRGPLAQLPNALTIARILSIPLIAVLLLSARGGHDWGAGIVLALAAATDQVDGWLARRWRVQSLFGKRADMLADGIVLAPVIVILVHEGRLPWIALALLGGREVVLLAARPLVHRGEFSVSFLGKLSAWLLYAGVLAIVVTRSGTDWPLWIFWTGVALDLASGAHYVWAASQSKHLRSDKGRPHTSL